MRLSLNNNPQTACLRFIIRSRLCFSSCLPAWLWQKAVGGFWAVGEQTWIYQLPCIFLMKGKFWEVEGCRRCVCDIHINVFLAQDFDWSLSTNSSPAFSLHFITTASKKSNPPQHSSSVRESSRGKSAADETASQITGDAQICACNIWVRLSVLTLLSCA